MIESFIDLVYNPYLLILIICFLSIATYTDIKYMLIFDKFNIIMLIVRIFTFFIFGFKIDYIIGGILMFLILLFAGLLSNKPMGGDIKFCGNLGLWFGFTASVIILMISLFLNLVYRKITKNINKIALAPFLMVAFIILLLFVFFLYK